MPIVGTAGHVDHGKSTLVRALTGHDPDRWAEEKERGLTIDLGFAWTRLDDETEIGFVDVPGHERFIKNMLAGVGALDVALFVVAADEGWKPQSEEHLAVLDLLDIRSGVVAVTRMDLVDGDLLELAILDVDDHIAGTALADWPIVPVSSITGAGLDELRTALAGALNAVGPPIDVGRPRLWIDRSFVISGAGVVVTGTLSGGSLRRDDEIVLWPGPRTARIRGIQSHEHDVDRVAPGTRTAINLVGVQAADVPRGTMLTAPGLFESTSRLLVDLRVVRSADNPVTDRGAYHLHAGTGAWPVEIRVVGDRRHRQDRRCDGLASPASRLRYGRPRHPARSRPQGRRRRRPCARSRSVWHAVGDHPVGRGLARVPGRITRREGYHAARTAGHRSFGNLAAHTGGGRPEEVPSRPPERSHPHDGPNES